MPVVSRQDLYNDLKDKLRGDTFGYTDELQNDNDAEMETLLFSGTILDKNGKRIRGLDGRSERTRAELLGKMLQDGESIYIYKKGELYPREVKMDKVTGDISVSDSIDKVKLEKPEAPAWWKRYFNFVSFGLFFSGACEEWNNYNQRSKAFANAKDEKRVRRRRRNDRGDVTRNKNARDTYESFMSALKKQMGYEKQFNEKGSRGLDDVLTSYSVLDKDGNPLPSTNGDRRAQMELIGNHLWKKQEPLYVYKQGEMYPHEVWLDKDGNVRISEQTIDQMPEEKNASLWNRFTNRFGSWKNENVFAQERSEARQKVMEKVSTPERLSMRQKLVEQYQAEQAAKEKSDEKEPAKEAEKEVGKEAEKENDAPENAERKNNMTHKRAVRERVQANKERRDISRRNAQQQEGPMAKTQSALQGIMNKLQNLSVTLEDMGKKIAQPDEDEKKKGTLVQDDAEKKAEEKIGQTSQEAADKLKDVAASLKEMLAQVGTLAAQASEAQKDKEQPDAKETEKKEAEKKEAEADEENLIDNQSHSEGGSGANEQENKEKKSEEKQQPSGTVSQMFQKLQKLFEDMIQSIERGVLLLGQAAAAAAQKDGDSKEMPDVPAENMPDKNVPAEEAPEQKESEQEAPEQESEEKDNEAPDGQEEQDVEKEAQKLMNQGLQVVSGTVRDLLNEIIALMKDLIASIGSLAAEEEVQLSDNMPQNDLDEPEAEADEKAAEQDEAEPEKEEEGKDLQEENKAAEEEDLQAALDQLPPSTKNLIMNLLDKVDKLSAMMAQMQATLEYQQPVKQADQPQAQNEQPVLDDDEFIPVEEPEVTDAKLIDDNMQSQPVQEMPMVDLTKEQAKMPLDFNDLPEPTEEEKKQMGHIQPIKIKDSTQPKAAEEKKEEPKLQEDEPKLQEDEFVLEGEALEQKAAEKIDAMEEKKDAEKTVSKDVEIDGVHYTVLMDAEKVNAMEAEADKDMQKVPVAKEEPEAEEISPENDVSKPNKKEYAKLSGDENKPAEEGPEDLDLKEYTVDDFEFVEDEQPQAESAEAKMPAELEELMNKLPENATDQMKQNLTDFYNDAQKSRENLQKQMAKGGRFPGGDDVKNIILFQNMKQDINAGNLSHPDVAALYNAEICGEFQKNMMNVSGHVLYACQWDHDASFYQKNVLDEKGATELAGHLDKAISDTIENNFDDVAEFEKALKYADEMEAKGETLPEVAPKGKSKSFHFGSKANQPKVNSNQNEQKQPEMDTMSVQNQPVNSAGGMSLG